ncbi:RPA family protein [Halosimplex amylolyticum]|uniref:RPA family protein n=1 Tax=Halosimplex amylolyticum TaxID=3396616 RepID=UPI003F548BD0
MSGSEDQGGAGRREVAYRLFAAEFEDADFSYSESDEERAPNYVVTPTGGRVNRLFVVGVLTEVENASEDVLRARVVDPTGAFVIYAGQYQPDAQAFFERAQPPMFVAVTGKARTFQPDDSDVTYTSIRPENVNEVDAETRDRWTVGTARQTLDRVRTMAHALRMDERGDELRTALEAEGVDTGLAAGIPLAIDHYGTTPAYLDAIRDTAVQALEVVTNDRDEVDAHSASPGASGDADLATLAALDVAPNVGGESTDLGGALDDESTAATGDEPGSADETGSADAASWTAGATETTTKASETTTEATESATETASETATTEATGSETEPSSEPVETETTADSEPVEAASTDESASEPAESASAEPGGKTAVAAESTETAADESGETDAAVESAPEESTASAGAEDADEDDLDDFDPGEFDLDEEEREEIEEEFGTEFQSGSEVGEPGEAGIETPDPDELAEDEAAADAAESDTSEPAESSAEAGSESESDEPSSEPEPAEDVDVEDAVMDAMRDLDDGDGAHADDIVDAVTGRTGAPADEVRDAIQDALMDGRCYEPDDDVYKPI